MKHAQQATLSHRQQTKMPNDIGATHYKMQGYAKNQYNKQPNYYKIGEENSEMN